MPTISSSVNESLCCCEYEDVRGERSHILACCCDCQALDESVDRCLTCKAVPEGIKTKLWSTIADRCRIPWCSGRGALRVPLDVIMPIIVIPLGLVIATWGIYTTIVILLSMPLFLFSFYAMWRRNQNRRRTQIFYSTALVSVLFAITVYVFYVINLQFVSIWEHLILILATILMFLCLYKAKRSGPGLVPLSSTEQEMLPYNRTGVPSVHNEDEVHSTCEAEKNESLHSHNLNKYEEMIENNPISNFLVANMGFQKDSFHENYLKSTVPTIQEFKVTWVDSRPIENGLLVTWCKDCMVKKPPRSGHCPICDVCIEVRDHHCVWIDSCVGSRNHRMFFFAMVLFVFSGFYGFHLTIKSICITDQRNLFIILVDCGAVYQDFGASLMMVTALYCMLAAAFMLIALIQQIVLIGQNLTSQELHYAASRGQVKCVMYASNNLHNKGLFRNWISFLLMKQRAYSEKIVV